MILTRAQFWQSAAVGVVFAAATFVGIQAGQAATSPPSKPLSRPSAVAPSATASTKVTACVNKKSGALRVLKSARCKSSETTVSWNAAGPRGLRGPKGDRGARGPAGSVTINGSKCAETQYIGYDGEKWTCVTAPITAFMYSDGSNLSFTRVDQGFKAFSANVAGDGGCNKETCVVRLYDVDDHETCTAQFKGGTFATDSEVLASPTNILIDFGAGWQQGQEMTITISCLR